METKTKKMMLIGLGMAGAGLAGYFSWQYFLRKKNEDEQPQVHPASPAPRLPAGPTTRKAPLPKTKLKPVNAAKAPANASDNFPLKPGSRGPKVKALQQALIARNGISVLPRYGADGNFGAELISALKKLKLPAQISETTFNVLTEAAAPDSSKLAAEIFKAAQSRNHAKVLAELKKLKSPADYTAVSSVFKNYRVDGGVRKSLVTGVLDSFADAKQKEQLKLEFERMGLVYLKGKQDDSKKWQLAGTDFPALITTRSTWVWKSKTEFVQVPKNIVLGRYVSKQRKFITFENAGQHFLVRAADVAQF